MEDYKVKKKVLIEGVHSGQCIQDIKDALHKLIGVYKVNVDLEEQSAIIDANTYIKDSTIKSVICNIGYRVIKIQGL